MTPAVASTGSRGPTLETEARRDGRMRPEADQRFRSRSASRCRGVPDGGRSGYRVDAFCERDRPAHLPGLGG